MRIDHRIRLTKMNSGNGKMCQILLIITAYLLKHFPGSASNPSAAMEITCNAGATEADVFRLGFCNSFTVSSNRLCTETFNIQGLDGKLKKEGSC